MVTFLNSGKQPNLIRWKLSYMIPTAKILTSLFFSTFFFLGERWQHPAVFHKDLGIILYIYIAKDLKMLLGPPAGV